jgi:hypothetical protein
MKENVMKKMMAMSACIVATLAGQAIAQPVIDGTRDASYGTALFLQTQPTQFGNSTLGDPDLANGSEINAVYGLVQNGKLYLFIAGNIETNFNKIDLFFDVQAGGQSPLRDDNVDIDFGGLNRMGAGPVGDPPVQAPGLTFDAGFEADYWLGLTAGNNPVDLFANAAVLRTNGPIKNVNFFPLDYGSYDGGLKSATPVVPFDGPQLDPQSGFAAAIFAQYGPRTAGASVQANPTSPVGTPDLIRYALNNSNAAGVTAAPDCNVPFTNEDPAAVTTGAEIEIDLAELGWDGVSPIRVAGFVNGSDHGFVSNQVIGGIPNSVNCNFGGNVGEVRNADFSQIPGDQFVTIPASAPSCYPDCDLSGSLNIDDFICFQTFFAIGDTYADCDVSGGLNIDDFICFQTFFALGC